jgi:hypothetical protein
MPELSRDYTSLRGLRLIWQDRDRRYATNRQPPTDAQVASVRAYRTEEAKDIFPIADIETAMREAMRWTPPHQFGR